MSKLPHPPRSYSRFVERFPRAGQAWDLLSEEGRDGPLDDRSLRLVKLGIAIGCMREGAVHSSVRKALAAGATLEEMEQVVALAAPTIGLPATVAVHGWVLEEVQKQAAP